MIRKNVSRDRSVIVAHVLILIIWFYSLPILAQARTAPQNHTVLIISQDNSAFTQRMVSRLSSAIKRTAHVIVRSDNTRDHISPDLYVTIGSTAFTKLAESEQIKVPVLSLFIDSVRFQQRAGLFDSPVTALFHDAPLIQQALLGKQILPGANTFALLVEPVDAHRHDQSLQQLERLGLSGKVFIVDNPGQLMQVLSRALKHSDFLLGTQDSQIFNLNTIKHILLSTYRQNRVLIGPGRPYVLAGALASAYPATEAYLSEAIQIIQSFLQTQELPLPHFSKNFNIDINEQVARSMKLALPNEEVLIRNIQADMQVEYP